MSLDNPAVYTRLDRGRVAESIVELPLQIAQVLKDARRIKVPQSYRRVTQVVVNGMGGSNLGTHLLRSAFADRLKVPVTIEAGYSVPASVDKNTLYIISSYSGTTEEPLSVYAEVKKRGAKVMAITEDSPQSKLKRLMEKDGLPGYAFRPEHNPSGQPRLGTGYSIFGKICLMQKAGVIEFTRAEIEDVIVSMIAAGQKLLPDVKAKDNIAKKIALSLKGKTAVLVSAEHLRGNLHVAKNQINECSKAYADYLEIPDLNHYAMEGLANPASNRKTTKFFFFESALFHPRVQDRIKLTREVVKKNGIAVDSYRLREKKALNQNFELLQLGSWISYYLGILYGVEPDKIPFVDWFKKKLA